MEWNEEATMSDLAKRRCEPCAAGTPPIEGAELERLLSELPGWSVVGGGAGTRGGGGSRLEKEYRFPDFRQALAFVNRVGEVAEQEGHHPDLELGWGRVKITLWTHSIGGLSENDFIVAAKADRLLSPGS
jgi:4a-hydroxytetrahydrobiopterin dehydratase